AGPWPHRWFRADRRSPKRTKTASTWKTPTWRATNSRDRRSRPARGRRRSPTRGRNGCPVWGSTRAQDPEHAAHPRMNAAEERIGPGRQILRRAPFERAHARQRDPELAGVEVAGAARERVGDPVVEGAGVLARGDRVEDRCHVERVRRDDVERREWAR